MVRHYRWLFGNWGRTALWSLTRLTAGLRRRRGRRRWLLATLAATGSLASALTLKIRGLGEQSQREQKRCDHDLLTFHTGIEGNSKAAIVCETG